MNENQNEHHPFPAIQSFGWGKALLFVLLFAIAQGIIGFGLMSLIPNEDISLSLGLLLSYIAVIWFVSREVGWPDVKTRGVGFDAISIFVSFALFMAFKMAVMTPLEFIPGYQQLVDMYVDTFGDLGPMTMFMGAIIAPVAEELFFRGQLQGGLTNRFNAKHGILISSLLFGLIHMIPIQVVGAFAMGLVLAWIYHKTKSLWLPILLHLVNNLFSMVYMHVSDEDEINTLLREDLGDLGAIGLAVACFAISYWAYQFLDKRWTTESEELMA